MAIDCPSCGGAAPDGAKFCPSCGAAMAVGCAACGAPLAPGARFCAQCGTPVDPTAVGAAAPGTPPPNPSTSDPAASTSERKLVSVLFADLVGFTASRRIATPRTSATCCRATSNGARRSSAATAARSRSSSATRSWPSGARPIAHEDDAERAVRAALELRRRGAHAGAGHPGARRGPDRRGRGHPRAPPTRAWSPATSSTPRPGSSRVAPPGTRARRRGDVCARPARAIAFEPAGRAGAQGQGRAGAGVARASGSSPSAAAAAGPRRSRRRSSAATTSCACSRTCSTRRARAQRPRTGVDHGPGGHRQEPPGVGVREVPRRPRRDRLVAPRAARPAYGEGITFWALGEMVRGRARPGRGRRRGDDPQRPSAATSTSTARGRPGAALGRARRSSTLLGVGAATGVAREELFGAWRTFFERIARAGHGGARVRGPALGRRGLARLHRPPARLVDAACRSSSSRWPARSCSSSGRTGAPAERDLHRHRTSSRCREAAMRELLAGLVPGLPATAVAADRRAGRRHPAVRGRDRPDARRRGPAGRARTAVPSRPATSPTSPCPRRCTALIAARLDALDAGRSGARPRCRRAGPELHAGGPRRGQRARGRGPRAAPALARPSRAARRPDGPAHRPSVASTRSSRR